MNYKLAEELKDAGFPFVKSHPFWEDLLKEAPEDAVDSRTVDGLRHFLFNKRWYKAPTLVELIEACGDEFMMLVQRNVGQCWGAISMDHLDERGSTPEAAVARLWLSLEEGKEA